MKEQNLVRLRYKDIKYGLKGSTDYGVKRELELLNDKCITCFHLDKPFLNRYCNKRNTFLKGVVLFCGYFTNENLNNFILESKGLISPNIKGV